METTERSRVALYEQYPNKGNAVPVRARDTLVCFFSYRGYCYAAPLRAPGGYGWLRVSPELKPLPSKKEVKAETLDKYTIDRINQEFDSVNSRYRRYYSYFNQRTGAQKPVPRWQLLEFDRQMVWVLHNASGKELESSTEVLVSSLEDIVLGLPYLVHLKELRIEIIPRHFGQ